MEETSRADDLDYVVQVRQSLLASLNCASGSANHDCTRIVITAGNQRPQLAQPARSIRTHVFSTYRL